VDILWIKLFGRVKVSHDNWKTEVNITRIVQGLLAYLLLQRNQNHSRDLLAALFWGEQNQEKARGCLNTALWRLRSALEPTGVPHGTFLVSSHFGEVGFNQDSRYWLDVAIFEEQIKDILTTSHHSIKEEEVEKIESVMQLYKGDLLEGFYDDWALRERERLRSLYLNGLAYLMKYEKRHGYYEKGLAYGRQILELDPLREEIHREMMRLYVENGQRALAVRQYKACCDILRAELNIQPMEETQALYDQILLSRKLSFSNLTESEESELLMTLQDLKLVAQSAEQIQKNLTRAIGSIESFIDDIARSSINGI
jgi:DNA-binding SARP family transcriptional activator